MIFIIRYVVGTLLAAIIDALRIRFNWGKQANVDHSVSGLIALIIAVFCALIPSRIMISVLSVADFGLGYAAARLLFYSIFLNLLRREKWNYVSPTTTSWTDKNIPFWWQRAIGFILLAASIYIQWTFLQPSN